MSQKLTKRLANHCILIVDDKFKNRKMTRKLFFSFLALICVGSSAWAQKKDNTNKTNTPQSNAEKMGYARTNKYWGPGTYYCFAPGAPVAKMVNTQVSAMRDLTGISREDCYKELSKQGFKAVPPKEVERWFNENKSKDKKFFYSPDKSYILKPNFRDMYNSQEKDFMPYSTDGVECFVLVPKQDSLKVIEMVWQYLRDLYNMKIILSSFTSTFKRADPKSYPIQQAGSSGWTSMRAGSFVLKMVDGKPKGFWERNEAIVRRTIGNPEFDLRILGMETDYWYSMRVALKKEGYIISYNIVAGTLSNLEPGATWTPRHKEMVIEYNTGLKMDKEAVDVYKKAPLPPKLEDIDKLLHIK